ncbi:signal recognition particle subunit SRP72 [Orussus abietinus]|uniref:signal recognition particle subunit SRP72 n=1 Tax=Orussus abietinus TaxID=222816 RepID=UPI0006263D5B|nr:signal recognition particle subunit SRP72 [Orussus abietinus]
MATKESNVSSLYAELNKLGQSSEYERALKTANKILTISEEEEPAFHCKIVCFIQLGRFKEALQSILNFPKQLANLVFEKAYALYRLNEVTEALKVVDSVQNPSLRIKELKAQILYRLERYEECFSVYRDIIKNSNDEYEDERETNLAAVIANLAAEGLDLEVPTLKENTYEQVYNAACQLVSQATCESKELLIEAENKLKMAEKMCRESLEEDEVPLEKVDEEIAIIKVQLAYCLQLQGREKEAQALYSAALKSSPSDIALNAVANNNLLTLNKDQNIFDSKKRMKSAFQEGLEHRLTSKQRRTIAYNQCLLALYVNQGDRCQQLCDKLATQYPELTSDAMFVKALQMSKEDKTKEAVKIINEHAFGEHQLQMKLNCIQVLLNHGERHEAIKVLESLNEKDKSLPGIVSALVTFYMAENNRQRASSVLKDAVNYYKKNKEMGGNLETLWRQAADFHLRSGEVEVVAASLEELLHASPSDTKILAQLVIAYAQFDSARAQLLSKRLPPLHDLAETVNVDALESSNWIIGTKVIKRKVEASPGTPATDLIRKRIKKRKRKGKLPKTYDPNVPPDPERWLPRHERSGYRKKRDRRNRDSAMKGTQGAATGASDMYDITKMQAKPSPNVRNSPAVESSGPRQQQRKVQQKKKRKGGKW